MATTEDDDDYQNGKAYSIVCNITKEQYIGSTILTLEERLRRHNNDYNRWLQDNNNPYTSSFQILERGDFKIILLENCPCNNSNDLRMRERYWYDIIPNVNIIKPFVTEEERKEHFKEYYKQYREQNKEYFKVYREQNKEKIKEQIKKRNNQPFKCECGGNYTYVNKSTHFKSKKHLDYLNTKEATNSTEI